MDKTLSSFRWLLKIDRLLAWFKGMMQVASLNATVEISELTRVRIFTWDLRGSCGNTNRVSQIFVLSVLGGGEDCSSPLPSSSQSLMVTAGKAGVPGSCTTSVEFPVIGLTCLRRLRRLGTRFV